MDTDRDTDTDIDNFKGKLTINKSVESVKLLKLLQNQILSADALKNLQIIILPLS